MGKIKKLPLTLPGTAIIVITLVILVRSLAARNPYEIVLSLTSLILLCVLFFTAAWTVRRLAGLEPDWQIPTPLGAKAAEDWFVSGNDAGIPRFFRLHFLLRGRFYPQGSPDACLVFAETSQPRKSKNNTARLSLSFPMGGFFYGETSCRLRDIFGLFSFHCGVIRGRTLKIRSAPCEPRVLRIDAHSGAEDRRNKTASDEERYYMREYAPGDRFRDINWKSSERVETLITRISPDNQEKITRIEVYFRNYGRDANSIADLWLLDRCKARLAWFLRKVKEDKGSYVFNVRSAGQIWDLNDDEEIEAFLEDLASVSFSPAQNEESLGTGNLYVFSTGCDTTLPAFLLAQQARPVKLFLTQSAGKASGEKLTPEAPGCLRLRDFPAEGIIPRARWFLPAREKMLKVGAGDMMVDYAETRL